MIGPSQELCRVLAENAFCIIFNLFGGFIRESLQMEEEWKKGEER